MLLLQVLAIANLTLSIENSFNVNLSFQNKENNLSEEKGQESEKKYVEEAVVREEKVKKLSEKKVVEDTKLDENHPHYVEEKNQIKRN